jgi:hypothetical protein
MLDRHGRDPGTLEIIERYDQPERCDWSLLTESEASFLHGEILKCMNDYSYFARNYCWITTKEMQDIPLRLKDTQELILETVNRVKERGRGVKLLIIKARQLYASTFVESYIAWLARFNSNANSLVLSYDEDHAAFLFSIILHIYDKLPWWLRPMIGSRKYEEGLHLINPDPNMRNFDPGLNTRIIAQGAKRYAGVAEGYRINFAHISELGSMDPARARSIVHGDLRWALPDNPSTFAVIESRVKKGAKMLEKLWEGQIELGDMATWVPLFLPIYFDKTHFIPPKAGWVAAEPERAIQKRAADDWCTCNGCGQIRPSIFGGESTASTPCKDCKAGTYRPYALTDGQMRWLMEQRVNAEKSGDKAVIEMKQSLATNPQEAFQYVTESIFSKEAQDFLATKVREPLAVGYMDASGKFHAPREQAGSQSSQCYVEGCTKNHIGQPERFLKVWQLPVRGARYAMGIDVASGMGGSHDYAVVWVNRVGVPPIPDVHVATFRSNTVSPMHLADVANAIGRWYNNAKAIVDYSNHQTCGDRLVHFHRYTNIYRWKNLDSLNTLSPRLHWIWNRKNKEDGWVWLDGWLRDKSFIAQDAVLAREVRYYQRRENGELGSTQAKEQDDDGDSERVNDDTVSAVEQCLMGSHDTDYRREGQGLPADEHGLKGSNDWLLTCLSCGRTWNRDVYNATERCPYEHCRGLFVRWHHKKADEPELAFKFDDMATDPGADGSSHFGQCQDLIF